MLEAEGQTDIAAGVTGIVDEVLFREGDAVETDAVLVKVDQNRYRLDVEVARASLQRARAEREAAEAGFRIAQRAKQGVSEDEKTAKLGLWKAKEGEAALAENQLDRARHFLNLSQVRARYPGQINSRKVTVGMYVEEKTVIGTMADLSRLRLVGYVPETAAPVLREMLKEHHRRVRAMQIIAPLGAAASPLNRFGGIANLRLPAPVLVPASHDPEFTLLAIPQKKFHARVFFMSTVADPSTHMFEVKAEILINGKLFGLHPEQALGDELRPGYTAKIRFPLRSNPDAVIVPEEAVRASERGFLAFVPVKQTRKDGTAEWVVKARPLTLGYRADGMVEVRQGLEPGELIVRRGAEALEDGTPIRFGQIPE
jgi:membrane fusion protein (multidrug efflux system)/multidrug efflux system membrane fusion protein